MPAAPLPTARTLAHLTTHELDLLPGQTQDFHVDDRVVTVHGTDSGVTVISADHHAVVLRPQTDGSYIVTGATASASPSQAVSRPDAIRIALTRLEH